MYSILTGLKFNHLVTSNRVPKIERVNPLPHMPILASSNSVANKDMMS